MYKSVCSFLVASLFLVQTLLQTYPLAARPLEPLPRDEIAPLAVGPISTTRAILDQKHPQASLNGLDVFFHNDGGSSSPVIVETKCYGDAGTPSMAVDHHVYGSDARLLNLTRRPENGCSSYEVAAEVLGAPSRDTSVSPGIAVAIHYSGPTSADVKTPPGVFVFNPVHGNWTEAKAFTPPKQEPQTAYATLSENRQRIIGGVISLPKGLDSQPVNYSPSALSQPLTQLSPLDGYLAVKNITPDNKGAFNFSLPLLLRPSRGPGPSFSVGYSSQGRPGVLGRGWDLAVSAIEVRGPSPFYHPGSETEDYTLDGADLIPLDANGRDIPPLYKGGPIIPRVSTTRLFRLRNNSTGLIVRRYGNTPDNYYWEVWDPNSHITRLYGGEFNGNRASPKPTTDGNGLLRGVVPLGDGGGRTAIGQWALTQEYDSQAARSGASYVYIQNNNTGRGCPDFGTECSAALRLDYVEYNLAFGAQMPETALAGVTRVKFQWEKRDKNRKSDQAYDITDARLGFLRAQEFWLQGIDVLYKPDSRNSLWASLGVKAVTDGYVRFARHTFTLGGENNACLNNDRFLVSYEVTANDFYDNSHSWTHIPLDSQKFDFKYDGENCNQKWSPTPLSTNDTSAIPASAPEGQISFPSPLLESLGFGLLTSQSILGTSRSEETGASLFVGIGPADKTNVKEIALGLKAGVDFGKSEVTSTLIDVTGDGIPDVVYKLGDKLSYCAGVRAPYGTHAVTYPQDRCGVIDGIKDLPVSSTFTFSAGAEVYAPGSAFAGVGFNSAKNDNYVYFSDVDGDGLVDLVDYGRVYYNQGETRRPGDNRVLFAPKRGLKPPIPFKIYDPRSGRAREQREIILPVPVDLRATIEDIETRLSRTSERLQALKYSQTTLAWQAPLDGVISINGSLELGSSKPPDIDLGAWPTTFTAQEFEKLWKKVQDFQSYWDDRAKCKIWSDSRDCYASTADPFQPHYASRTKIAFIETHPAHFQLSVSREADPPTVYSTLCYSGDVALTGKDLSKLKFAPACQPVGDLKNRIRVREGDVLYLTYSIHPHFAAYLKPNAEIRYAYVDGDAAFNAATAGDPQHVLKALPCNWKEASRPGSEKCLLANLSRYQSNLRTGMVTSAPNDQVELAPGTERVVDGRLRIPADFSRDYQVYLEILGEPEVTASGAPGVSPSLTPASILRPLFRQDISKACLGVNGICTLVLDTPCVESRDADCKSFYNTSTPFVLSARVVVHDQVAGLDAPAARNITDRLRDFVWLRPPAVNSKLKEVVGSPRPNALQPISAGPIYRTVATYLPVAMGEPDLDFFRVESGKVANPDQDLHEGDPPSDTIDFKDIVEEEHDNVGLARTRQTAALCSFGAQTLRFLNDRMAFDDPRYGSGYLGHWQALFDVYALRCIAARKKLEKIPFTSGVAPIPVESDDLHLSRALQSLTGQEQITSAQTLLDRILRNLSLGEDLLTDQPRLSQRGYRLPSKANPFDCIAFGDNQSAQQTIEAPISDRREGRCTFRLLSNFAMRDFDDLLGVAKANELRRKLADFAHSGKAAFTLDLTATINGKPIRFRELTAENTEAGGVVKNAGNEICEPQHVFKTCLGNYGTIGPSQFFYPQEHEIYDDQGRPTHKQWPKGDAFQRITTNKRTGRAAAFSNNIMSNDFDGVCTRKYPSYNNGTAIDRKQDCLYGHSDIGVSGKYLPESAYVVRYTVNENNHFIGRNRIIEFDGRPLDLLELHFRLAPVRNKIDITENDPSQILEGAFSVFKPTDPALNFTANRYLIPRSPADILPRRASRAECGTQNGRPISTCRPWTEFGWTEVLLGAQYRTYSDAQITASHKRYSLRRRREILRLQPEIEVAASDYALSLDASQPTLPAVAEVLTKRVPIAKAATEAVNNPLRNIGTVPSPDGAAVPAVSLVQAPTQYLAFFDRHPDLDKTGGEWAFFAEPAGRDGQLVQEPSFASLRHNYLLTAKNNGLIEKLRDNYQAAFGDLDQNCKGTSGDPDYDSCESSLGQRGQETLDLDNFQFFPLKHRFIGPVAVNAVSTATARGAVAGVCGAEIPVATASCWKSADDTVYLEADIIDDEKTQVVPPYSVSALLGMERPPIAQFNLDFEAFEKIVRMDPNNNVEPAAVELSVAPPQVRDRTARPDRPAPPPQEQAIEVFAPVQSTTSHAISRNAGVVLLNLNQDNSDRQTTSRFMDVNGFGFPARITNGRAELMSPVGLTRKDWWRYFRVSEGTPAFAQESDAGSYDQAATSESQGRGIGLSPSTFAVFQTKGETPKYTGSPDTNVDPSFEFSTSDGRDTKFTDFVDLNGDGLPDKLEADLDGPKTGLSSVFNTGNSVNGQHHDFLVGGQAASGIHFNTTHSAGFGIRLGFSADAGSFGGGTGLAHRDSRSEAAFVDFTGSGRPDLVTMSGDGHLIIYPNLGNGFGPAKTIQLDDPDTPSGATTMSESSLADAGGFFTAGTAVWFLKFVFTPGVKLARGQERELISIRDINGSGVPSVVAVSGDFSPLGSPGRLTTKIYYNPEATNHLLAAITNPSGSSIHLRYGLFGNTGPEHGRPVWALTEVATDDGYNPNLESDKLPPHGQDLMLTKYDYSDGYFNRAERQFYGFRNRVVTLFGCNYLKISKKECFSALNSSDLKEVDWRSIGYNEVRKTYETYSNDDFFTQGMLLSQTIVGVQSSANPGLPSEEVVARSTFGYSIDNLVSLDRCGEGGDRCRAPPDPSKTGTWKDLPFEFNQSALSTTWAGKPDKQKGWSGPAEYGNNGTVFGVGGICGEIVNCKRTLQTNMGNAGLWREQVAFWAQQSGSVRQRFVGLETFANTPADTFRDKNGKEIAINENGDETEQQKKTSRLRSAVAFDQDRFGQVVNFASLGELASDWTRLPTDTSSLRAEITYAPRQGLDAAAGETGYPMLGLAQDIKISAISADGWNNGGRPLRAREAEYSTDGQGNLSDLCEFPGGRDFYFIAGMCVDFHNNMRDALSQGYSSMEGALRASYDRTNGLPKGVWKFNAVIHHQLTGYDAFGNLTEAISPLSSSKEWIERRFDYSRDPFIKTPTSTELTRCVQDVAGAGADSQYLKPNERCKFGLPSLPEPVQRKAITHVSTSRVDTHFGVVAETRDTNANSLLTDFDRWGRITLIARSWGNAPSENKTFEADLDLAVRKDDSPPPGENDPPKVMNWRLLAVADYEHHLEDPKHTNILRSNIRRFEDSDSYSGLLNGRATTRETSTFADGLGRLVQSIREADVCIAAKASLIDQGQNEPLADVNGRCEGVATGVVSPAPAIDVLGRSLETYESYPTDPAARKTSERRYTDLRAPSSIPDPLVVTIYDGAGRPLSVASRLAGDLNVPGLITGTAQYHYRVVPEEIGKRLPRFEALSVSPRCTAAAVWSDARGLKREVFEDQKTFYSYGPASAPSIKAPDLSDPAPYKRDHNLTRGFCLPIGATVDRWDNETKASLKESDAQPSRVSYSYDPLQQLIGVDSPLEGTARASIDVDYDMVGRTLEIHDQDSGCSRFAYDGLNLLISEEGFRYEAKPCGTTSQVRNEKSYTYAADRLIKMSYHSLEDQGGAGDAGDAVRLFYDRYPFAALNGEILETPRFVLNDQANQHFVDVTGRRCENCIGRQTLLTDRTGARSFSYNELGLARREIRSIVAPLRDVKQSGGKSETYLPEVAFYEQENSYTAFGDPIQEKFSESAPSNPSNACLQAGVETCLARFTIGRKYAPDGAVAGLFFNGKPMINAIQDGLGRPAARWTSNGITTAYRYDSDDLRLNQMATIAAASKSIQAVGYQYDGGGNIVQYVNKKTVSDEYGSGFAFRYDSVSRVTDFAAKVVKNKQSVESNGKYSYDSAYRFKGRVLNITGLEADGHVDSRLLRHWSYNYANNPSEAAVHAPQSIIFSTDEKQPRIAHITYDNVGRMISVENSASGDAVRPKQSPSLVSNRAMTWDAEGRLLRVRGVDDSEAASNSDWLREDYSYDAGGNRTLKLDRPRNPRGDELEGATIYMTPFYARPYDARGTVQLSQGTTPTVSLAAPADQSEDGSPTFLYSDLAVGSITASIAANGEPTDERAMSIDRREYSPYGLELTADYLATTGDKKREAPSIFHAKELDRSTSFSSFGARYYSRDAGFWLSPDLISFQYILGVPNGGVYEPKNISTYGFVGGNPANLTDTGGMCSEKARTDGCLIVGKTSGDISGKKSIDPTDPIAINGTAISGSGEDRYADFSLVDLSDLGSSIQKTTKDPGSTILTTAETARRTGKPVDFRMTSLKAAYNLFQSKSSYSQQLAIGRFSVSLEGSIRVNSRGQWSMDAVVKGEVDRQDYPYDSRRSYSGTFGTALLGQFQKLGGGKDYDVHFLGEQRINVQESEPK